MDFNIMLLNVMTYTSKKTGEVLSQMNYMFSDKDYKSENKNFKGYGVQSSFTSGREFFEEVPFEWVGKIVRAHVEDRSYPDNPLQTKKVVVSLEYDGKTINLF